MTSRPFPMDYLGPFGSRPVHSPPGMSAASPMSPCCCGRFRAGTPPTSGEWRPRRIRVKVLFWPFFWSSRRRASPRSRANSRPPRRAMGLPPYPASSGYRDRHDLVVRDALDHRASLRPRILRSGCRRRSRHPRTGRARFPRRGPADYWDCVHFAVVIGVASQTADIALTSQRMRRIGTVHGVVAFSFNTVTLALTINILAGSL